MEPIKIFVSCSRRDRQWVDDPEAGVIAWLKKALAERDGSVDIWYNLSGSLSQEENVQLVRSKIMEADIAILLVSKEYTMSRRIGDHEVPLIKDRQRRGHLTVMPILVRPFSATSTERGRWIESMPILPDPLKPLSDIVAHHDEWESTKNQILEAVSAKIRAAQNKRSAGRPAPVVPSDTPQAVPGPVVTQTSGAAVSHRRHRRRRKKEKPDRTGLVFVGGIIVIALVGFALYFMANHKHHAPKPVVVAPVGSLTTNPTDDAALVWIPAGPFVMGSTDADGSALRDEKPAHKVTLDGYYIYKNDVTVAQYRAFCVATGRALPATSSFVAEDDQPVVDVSWDDAMAYASWANAGLPTEAQWEKAARGVNGIIYPWGNTWDPGKCVNAVGKDLTTKRSPEAIGSCPGGISPYGVYDMTGDVSQWCFDIYYSGYYDESPSVNPLGPQDGHERAVRGGAFDLPDIASFRVARRRHFAHTETADDLGFRCVYSPPHE